MQMYPLAKSQPKRSNKRPKIQHLTDRQLVNFWKRVDKNQHADENSKRCWLWTGGHNGSGRATMGLVLFVYQILNVNTVKALKRLTH